MAAKSAIVSTIPDSSLEPLFVLSTIPDNFRILFCLTYYACRYVALTLLLFFMLSTGVRNTSIASHWAVRSFLIMKWFVDFYLTKYITESKIVPLELDTISYFLVSLCIMYIHYRKKLTLLFDCQLQSHIEILASAVTQINEPDSLYGIIQSHKVC